MQFRRLSALRLTLLATVLSFAPTAFAQTPDIRPEMAASWKRLASEDPQVQKARWGDLATAAGKAWVHAAPLADLGTSWREIDWLVPGAAMRYRRGFCIALKCHGTTYLVQYNEVSRELEFLEDGQVAATGRVTNEGSVRVASTSLLGLLNAETLRMDAAAGVLYSDAHDMQPASPAQLAQATRGFAGQDGAGKVAAVSSPSPSASIAAAPSASPPTAGSAPAAPAAGSRPPSTVAPGSGTAGTVPSPQSEAELRAELAAMRARMEVLSRQLEQQPAAGGTAQGSAATGRPAAGGTPQPDTPLQPQLRSQSQLAQAPAVAPGMAAAQATAGTSQQAAPPSAPTRAEQMRAEREAKARAAEEQRLAAAEKAREEAGRRAEAAARAKEQAQARAEEARRLAQEKREREETARREAAEAKAREAKARAEEARRVAEDKRQKQEEARRAAEEAKARQAEHKAQEAKRLSDEKARLAALQAAGKPIVPHAALAVGTKVIHYGWSRNAESPSAAEKEAITHCQRSGDTCRVVLGWSGKGCGDYRSSEDGEVWGWGLGGTNVAAASAAFNDASQRSKGRAHNSIVAICNTWTTAQPLKELRKERARILRQQECYIQFEAQFDDPRGDWMGRFYSPVYHLKATDCPLSLGTDNIYHGYHDNPYMSHVNEEARRLDPTGRGPRMAHEFRQWLSNKSSPMAGTVIRNVGYVAAVVIDPKLLADLVRHNRELDAGMKSSPLRRLFPLCFDFKPSGITPIATHGNEHCQNWVQ
jgi:hypothetical protein